MNEAIDIMRDVIHYAEGTGKFDFADDDNPEAAFLQAWLDLKARMEAFVFENDRIVNDEEIV